MDGTTRKKWAAGIVVTTSGLAKEEKLEAQRKIKQAGGDYSPNLSRRCTHVLTRSGTDSQKLDALRSNPHLWPQAIICLDWLTACELQEKCLPPGQFSMTKRGTEIQKPLGNRQQFVGTWQTQSLTTGDSITHCSRPPDPTTATTTATGACLTAQPLASSRPTSTHNPRMPVATPWVLQPALFVKPETTATMPKPPGPWQNAPAPSAAPVPPAAPASTATVSKPAPWRVHFSQAEDPVLGFHTAAPGVTTAEVPRRPWRVRVSSIPEDNPPAPGIAPFGGGGAEADAEPGGGGEDQLQCTTTAEDSGGAGATLPQVKPWHVRHAEEPSPDDLALPAALQLQAPAVAAGAEPPNLVEAPRSSRVLATAAKPSSLGRPARAYPAPAGAEERRWTQSSSKSDNLPARHPAAIALLEALASPRSSQGSALSNVVQTAQQVGLDVFAAAAAASGRIPWQTLEPSVALQENLRCKKSMLRECVASGDVAMGLHIREAPNAIIEQGVEISGQQIGTRSTIGGHEGMLRSAGGTMAAEVAGTGYVAPGIALARIRDKVPDPSFPSLTQLAADLQALRQDFVAMPQVADVPPMTAVSPMPSNEKQPDHLPHFSPAKAKDFGFSGARDRANNSGQNPVEVRVGETCSSVSASALSTTGTLLENSAVGSGNGEQHYSRGGSSKCGNTLGGEFHKKHGHQMDRTATRGVEELTGNPDHLKRVDTDHAQQVETGGATVAVPRFLQAGEGRSGHEEESAGWASPLSQLAVELAAARQDLGEGSTKSPALESDELAHCMLAHPEAPPPPAAATQHETDVPDSNGVERDVSGREQSNRARLAVLGAHRHAPPFPFPHLTSDEASRLRAGPPMVPCDAYTDTTAAMADGLNDGAYLPGPMTQLIMGMREAREGLLMGYGHGDRGGAAAEPALGQNQLHDTFSPPPQPRTFPPSRIPVPEAVAEAGPSAELRGPQRRAASPTLAEMWGVKDCEHVTCDVRSSPQPENYFAGAVPGPAAVHQVATPVLIQADGRTAGFHFPWAGDVSNPAPARATPSPVTAAVSAATVAAAVAIMERPAADSGKPAQGYWNSNDDSYIDATAAPSLTQLIKGLQEARQELRIPVQENRTKYALAGDDSAHLNASFRLDLDTTAPDQRQSSVPCVIQEVACQEAVLGGLNAAVSVSGPSGKDDGEFLGGPGVRGTNGADDISFSELVRLMQQQKLNRTHDARAAPEMGPGICSAEISNNRDPPALNAQVSPPDVGGPVGVDSLSSELGLPDGCGPRDGESSCENQGIELNDKRAGADLSNQEGADMEWERDMEEASFLQHGVRPRALLPPTESMGAGYLIQDHLVAAPIVAPIGGFLPEQSIFREEKPIRGLQQPGADSQADDGHRARAAGGGAEPVGGGKRQDRAAFVISVAVATASAAIATAAATPLPFESECIDTSTGTVLTGLGAALDVGQIQSARSTQGNATPSPSPSPDLRPAVLLSRFGPSPLSPRAGAIVTGTALTTADICDKAEQEIGGIGSLHIQESPSLTAAEALGPSASSPLHMGEKPDDFMNQDGRDEGCHTPIASASDFTFCIDRHGKPQFNDGGCNSGGSKAEEGDSGHGYGDGGHRRGNGDSKPAARKMDSRTPTLLSTQGRRKRRQPRRLTPGAMKAPFPVLRATPPGPTLDANSHAGLSVASSLRRRTPVNVGLPSEPRVSQNQHLSRHESPLLLCKPESAEDGAAPEFVEPFTFQRPRKPLFTSTAAVEARAATEAFRPMVVTRQSHPESLGQDQDYPDISGRIHANSTQGYHQQRHQSQKTGLHGSQSQGLAALLRAPVLASQSIQRCHQGQSQSLSALLLSSQAPSNAPLNLPILKPEEIWMRRSQMPWATERSPRGFPLGAIWSSQGHTMRPTAIGTVSTSACSGEDAMPITPGPWLDGEDSDEEVLDVEALVAAGRAAAGFKTPARDAATPDAVLVPDRICEEEGFCHSRGCVWYVGGRALETKAVAKEAVGSLGVHGNVEERAPTFADAESDAAQRQLRRTTFGASPAATLAVECITLQDVAAAAAQALPPDSQSPPQPKAASKPQAHQEAAFVAPGQANPGCDSMLAGTTAALGSLDLDDYDNDALKPRGLDGFNPGNQAIEGGGGVDGLRPSQQPPLPPPQQQGKGPLEVLWNEPGRRNDGASISAGLLKGAVVIIDRCLPSQQVETCAAAVEALGGRISSASHLGCGATAIVCEQSRASRWLAWGSHLLSPRSLTRLAGGPVVEELQPKEGFQAASRDYASADLVCLSRGIAYALQRVIDDIAHPEIEDGYRGRSSQAKRNEDSGVTVLRAGGDGGASQQVAISADGDKFSAGGISRGFNSAEDPWPSLEARKQFLLGLKAREAAAGTRLQGLAFVGDQPTALQPAAPLTLLEDFVWTLTEAPHRAHVTDSIPTAGAEEDPFDALDEGADADTEDKDGMLMESSGARPVGKSPSFQQSQPGRARGEPRLVGPRDLDAVVFTGPRVTLLLPLDQHGLLGYHAITIAPLSEHLERLHAAKGFQMSHLGSIGSGISHRHPGALYAGAACNGSPGGSGSITIAATGRGITVRDLLSTIHKYYAQHMIPTEMAAAMATHPALRRELQVPWQRRALVSRSALLGRKVVLSGLRRCSLASPLAVYELNLMG